MRRLLSLVALLTVTSCASATGGGEHRYVVFFQEWSAQLDPAAKSAVAGAADEAKAHPTGKIMVIGFADTVGSAQANIDVSRLRAQVVADALTANGIDAGRIQRAARGATQFELSAQESRRVEIVVGP
jgi:outer membrane protein OmpA-like peptidoglycan-associated protein